MYKFIIIILLACSAMDAAIDLTPYDEDAFKAHFKRQVATDELVFTYLSNSDTEEISGSAFLVDIFGATYIATNRHVLDSVIIEGHQTLKLENNFKRRLKVDSDIYWQLNEPRLGEKMCTDLVLIPYAVDKFYYTMRPFELARRSPQVGQTAITYGNTKGQGKINAKEGIVCDSRSHGFSYIAATRKGNSGGPVLDLNNRVIGIHTAGSGRDLSPGEADHKKAIRLDHDVMAEWYADGRFELKEFPKDVVKYNKDDIYTDIEPQPHHSRNTQTPHLSMGLAVGNLSDANIGDLEHLEHVWDMKRRGAHRPLLCYNFDLLSKSRQIELCLTYGQTMTDFIPREWFQLRERPFVIAAKESHTETSKAHSDALRSRQSLQSISDRKAAIRRAKELGVFRAMRDAYNVRHQSGNKMRLDGEMTNISSCIENLDTGE